jgi:hypothetical protein
MSNLPSIEPLFAINAAIRAIPLAEQWFPAEPVSP